MKRSLEEGQKEKGVGSAIHQRRANWGSIDIKERERGGVV